MNLGGLGLYKKARMMFGKTYDPYSYWRNKGEVHNVPPDSNLTLEATEIIKYLQQISFKSVLEFGCGYGRVTRLINDNFKPKEYTAFDLSPHRIYVAKIECKDYSVDFQCNTIQEFNTEQKFDLVIGTNVLMHVLPKDIKSVIKHLLGFSNKHLVHSDPDYNSKKWENYIVGRTVHNIRHDYKQIYDEIGLTQSLKILPSNGMVSSIFHVQHNMENF